MTSEKPKVAFFFGAGASIKAGVPDTQAFLTQFLELLELEEDSEECLATIRLRDVLHHWADQQNPKPIVDIELALGVLDRLAQPGRDPLLPFIGGFPQEQATINPELAKRLLGRLRNFIKAKVTVSADAIGYLRHLRAFVDDFAPLDVYSANYDTCVEVFCSENRLRYRDGFDESWNPTLLNEPNLDIRLFKVHGSVTWYQTDRGRFVKIPILMQESSTTLLTGERAESLMLYPAQKYDYAEPLFELLIRMKEALSTCHTVFVVGYSFRDEHIRRIFWDVARANSSLHVVLIGPDAWQIYQRRLRTYEDGAIVSPLAERVVCLPFQFEDVLPALRGEFFRDMSTSWTTVSQFDRSEMAGGRVNWAEALLPTANAWNTEVLIRLFDKVDLSGPHYSYHYLSASIYGLLQSIGHCDTDIRAYFWGKLRNWFSAVFADIRVDVKPQQLDIQFNRRSGFESSLGILPQLFRESREIVDRRSAWLQSSEKHLTALSRLMDELEREISLWAKGPVKFDVYRDARNPLPGDLKQTFEGLSGVGGTMLDGKDQCASVAEQVRQIETERVNRILDKYGPEFETG